MSVGCISRDSLQFFTLWWLEGPSRCLPEAAFSAVVCHLGGRGISAFPGGLQDEDLAGGRKFTVCSLKTKHGHRAWAQKQPLALETLGILQGHYRKGRAQAGHCRKLPHRKMGPGTGFSEHNALELVQRRPKTWIRSSLNSAQLDNSLIPSQLEIS